MCVKFIEKSAINEMYINTTSQLNLQHFSIRMSCGQGLSQDLETGCPKLAIVKILGIQIVKGDHNIPLTCMNLSE